MKIGIIVGSVREGRAARTVAEWVQATADQREEATFEIVDLADFDLPMLTSPIIPGMANRQYDDERVVRFGQAIDQYDGFVFVTPEYNHSIPGAFKNAFDSLAPEWMGKTVAFVSYGADGGIRAVEHWRSVVANFSMHAVRQQVALSLFTELGQDGLQLQERRAGELDVLVDQLVAATRALVLQDQPVA
ncbi:NAD(P)H-dependent oxidoreductase [Janibacter melonis]|uniref:NADPH-dependent FMN reductase n=1 Tax=Janibacter melonis TaxID=262209 RepID=UPI0020446FF1|nr:NAD(P)H-dependent oxidoreductase [Janibacter melonis]MCM3555467.1 NAD(P)H-dependent oxidoreductase [Janibacter melonis]